MNKKWIVASVGIAAVALIFILTQAVSAVRWEQKVDPLVLTTITADGQAEFLVYLKEQADLSGADQLTSKAAKGQYVYQQLTAVAQRTQPPLLKLLDAQGAEYRRFWATNMIWVRGDPQVLQTMARATAVAHIYANPAIQLDVPQTTPAEIAQQLNLINGIEWNINHVNAPDVWALGYTGQGIVIGGQDTGYQWDHPALKEMYRGWDSDTQTADHNYNWHDAIHSAGSSCGYDLAIPCDDNNHGTHTMGTMVGDDGGSNQIGMAPGAEWISCRNMKAGLGSPATYTECYEWFIAPYPYAGDPFTDGDPSQAPHVINNSWSCPPEEGCSWDSLQNVVQAVRAAGIVTVHSAGNEGSSCSTVMDPAAIYAESFSVAATASNDVVTSFSSRGPVTIDDSNRLKPDISAPGLNIRSSYRNSGYGTMGGTSMAAPHVAGVVALLLSARPDLIGDVDGVEALVKATAVPLYTTQGCGGDKSTSLPNHTYGWGRIDALALINRALTPSLLLTGQAPDEVEAGGVITYTFTITNNHVSAVTHNVVLTSAIPAPTTFVSATGAFNQAGDVVTWQWATLAANESQTVQLAAQLPVTATDTLTHTAYGAVSDEATAVAGLPLTTTITPLPIPHELILQAAVAPTAQAGDLLTYTLTISHPHPSEVAHNVWLTSTIPAPLQFVTATLPFTQTADGLMWHWPELAADASATVQWVAQLPITATGSITLMEYGVWSDEVTAVAGLPLTTTITPALQHGLSLTATAPAHIANGEPLAYSFTITNQHGADVATNVVLTSSLPAMTTFITATGTFSHTGNMIVWHWAELLPNGAQTVQLVVQVADSATAPILHEDYGVKSDEVTAVAGTLLKTVIIRHQLYLPLITQMGVAD